MTSIDLLKQRGQLPAKTCDIPPGDWPIRKTQKVVYYLYDDGDLLKAYETVKACSDKSAEPSKLTFLDFLVLTRRHLLKRGLVQVPPRLLVPEVYNFEVLMVGRNHPDRQQLHHFVTETCTYEQFPPRVAKLLTLPQTQLTCVKKEGLYLSPLTFPSHTTGRMMQKAIQSSLTSGYFLIGTSFRREREDATHKMEFKSLQLLYPCTFEEIEPTFRELFDEWGLDVKIRRTFYPYTEPSFEVVFRKPERELQLAGGGLFLKTISDQLSTDKPVVGTSIGLYRVWGVMNAVL